jgi:hypothetical protein
VTPPVGQLDKPRTTQPLRSTPITGASSLLRAGPPARHSTPSPVPHRPSSPDSRRLHAGDHLARKRPHPPGSSQGRIKTLVLISTTDFDASTAVRSRSPSRTPPDAQTAPFPHSLTTTVFSQRSRGAVWNRPPPNDSEGPKPSWPVEHPQGFTDLPQQTPSVQDAMILPV